MKIRTLLALVLLVATLGATPQHAFAQAAPQFKLGFKALADRIPEIAGQPLEDEHWALNGDSLQRTARGLMVWRKADNWTAFTDGNITWINGPQGLQQRPNDRRLSWEGAAASTAAALTKVPLTFTGVYEPTVQAMDDESAAVAGRVADFVADLDAKWAAAWGWRPGKPVTIRLYYDGYRMADGLASLSVQEMPASRREEVATRVAGLKVVDPRTGGWAILVNLKRWSGTDRWEIRMKHLLTHEYTHVMQSDAARGAGPTWFHEGMAELNAFVEVPEALPYLDRTKYVSRHRDQGDLPGLRDLQTNWRGVAGASADTGQVAYGVSYLAVKYLSDKVGGKALLDVLEATTSGNSFEAALQNVTGYTLDRLDAEYRQTIPPPGG